MRLRQVVGPYTTTSLSYEPPEQNISKTKPITEPPPCLVAMPNANAQPPCGKSTVPHTPVNMAPPSFCLPFPAPQLLHGFSNPPQPFFVPRQGPPRVLNHDERVARRERQINIGKETVEYKIYTRHVPREERKNVKPKAPWTPNKYSRSSKRQFDNRLRKWRRDLHVMAARFDPNYKASSTTTPSEPASQASTSSRSATSSGSATASPPQSLHFTTTTRGSHTAPSPGVHDFPELKPLKIHKKSVKEGKPTVLSRKPNVWRDRAKKSTLAKKLGQLAQLKEYESGIQTELNRRSNTPEPEGSESPEWLQQYLRETGHAGSALTNAQTFLASQIEQLRKEKESLAQEKKHIKAQKRTQKNAILRELDQLRRQKDNMKNDLLKERAALETARATVKAQKELADRKVREAEQARKRICEEVRQAERTMQQEVAEQLDAKRQAMEEEFLAREKEIQAKHEESRKGLKNEKKAIKKKLCAKVEELSTKRKEVEEDCAQREADIQRKLQNAHKELKEKKKATKKKLEQKAKLVTKQLEKQKLEVREQLERRKLEVSEQLEKQKLDLETKRTSLANEANDLREQRQTIRENRRIVARKERERQAMLDAEEKRLRSEAELEKQRVRERVEAQKRQAEDAIEKKREEVETEIGQQRQMLRADKKRVERDLKLQQEEATRKAEQAVREAERTAEEAALEAARLVDGATREAERVADELKEKAARKAKRYKEKAARKAKKTLAKAEEATREAERKAEAATREAARIAEETKREAERNAEETTREAARKAEEATREAIRISEQRKQRNKQILLKAQEEWEQHRSKIKKELASLVKASRDTKEKEANTEKLAKEAKRRQDLWERELKVQRALVEKENLVLETEKKAIAQTLRQQRQSLSEAKQSVVRERQRLKAERVKLAIKNKCPQRRGPACTEDPGYNCPINTVRLAQAGARVNITRSKVSKQIREKATRERQKQKRAAKSLAKRQARKCRRELFSKRESVEEPCSPATPVVTQKPFAISTTTFTTSGRAQYSEPTAAVAVVNRNLDEAEDEYVKLPEPQQVTPRKLNEWTDVIDIMSPLDDSGWEEIAVSETEQSTRVVVETRK